MVKILVTGDRHYHNWDVIFNALKDFPEDDTIIITGGAKGADSIAKFIGEQLFGKNRVFTFEADWNIYGNAAGVIRNQLMIDFKPNLVLAFHDNIQSSRGTRDCIDRAFAAHIPILLFENGTVRSFTN